jgi:hypothetical protein
VSVDVDVEHDQNLTFSGATGFKTPDPALSRSSSILAEIPVHGGAGHPQHLRDVGGRDARVPELTGFGGFGVVDLARASALASVGCGSGQPGTGASIRLTGLRLRSQN